MQGTSRKANCDAAIVLTWPGIPRFNGQSVGLFIVADGMIQSSTSELAVQIIAQEIKSLLFEPNNLNISQIMTAAVQKANLQVIAKDYTDGTALTAALLIGYQAHIAHVGDSYAHYLYDNQLIQLTHSHTLWDMMVDLGHVTWEQIKAGEVGYPKHLYRVLGMNENLEVDILAKSLEVDSLLLLSTDGLTGWRWSYINESDLLSVVQKNTPQVACDKLIDLAQQGGSTDDITVVVIRVY